MVNSGIPLDKSLFDRVRINKWALDQRAAELQTRRSVKKQHQIAWLLRAVRCIDLTTLSGNDTPSNVLRLTKKAIRPVDPAVLADLGLSEAEASTITCGAVCVYPARVTDAVAGVEGKIPIASVATGFPAGQTSLETRLAEIRAAVADGAKEIDIVINRTAAIHGDWDLLYSEIKAMKAACGSAHMKTILATGELPTYTSVYHCSMVAMMAGSDFIKTSTGKEPVNATLQVGLVMCRAIRDYHALTGVKIGFKPAGGIRTAKQAVYWLVLMFEELGEEWTHPHLFRLGASTLLADIERQLYHGAYGRYHSYSYIAMS